MRGKTLRPILLAATVALLLTAGCVTINVPGGTTQPTEPTQTTQPTETTPTTPPTTPTVPTTSTIPTIPTVPTTPTIPTTPTMPTIPTTPPVPTFKPPLTLPVMQPALTGTEWVLEAMGEPGDLKPALTTTDVTLNFTDDTKLGGNGGCNSYSGKYEATAFGELEVSDITSTLMLCTKPGVAAQEHAFLDALDEAESYRVVGGKLQITAEDVLLVLVPA